MIPLAVRTALRSLRRRPGDAVINGVGLALGLACCALIALHVAAERGADRQHADGERVVRLVTDLEDAAGQAQRFPTVPRPVTTLVADDAAVEASALALPGEVRVRRTTGVEVARALYVSPGFLDVLNGFRLAAGDPATALAEPQRIVLTEAAALRLTGQPRPLGAVLDVGGDRPYTVTGVLADGGRSHLAFDVLVALDNAGGWDPTVWGNFDATVYARLAPGAGRAAFAQRVQAAVDAGIGDGMAEQGMRVAVAPQPLRDVYLADDGRLEMPGYSRAGAPGLLSTLALVGLFVLAVAAVNFVNLATARSAERAREIGVRKAVGADRAGLVGQFLAEAVVLALLAGVAALVVVALALPAYNGLTDAGLGLTDLTPGVLAVGLGVVVAVGLGAGLYPAVALSGFRPAETLRGQFSTGREGARLRRGLVVFQFAVSTALVVATLVVGAQLRHLRALDPGFDRDRVVLVSMANVGGDQEALLKDAFARVPGVQAVALTQAPPTEAGWEGQNVNAQGADERTQSMETVIADADYARALGIRVVAGRALSAESAQDAETGVLLNATAARALGWTPEEAVGQLVETSGRSPGEVVGVLADYAHHGSAQAPRPQIFFDQPGTASQAAVRVAPEAQAQALAGLREVWAARVDGYPFEAEPLGAAVDAQYRAQERLARAFALFAALAVVVAGLGLFGLAAYAVQRRTKEVGIRKVLGATVAQLVARLTADFARPVLVGVVLAAPVVWWGLGRWLDGFPERVALTPAPFIVAGLVALAAAVLTVSVHVVRAATADPVRALRSD